MSETVLMTLVWNDQTGAVKAKLPDHPADSAAVSGPTAVDTNLDPAQVAAVAAGLGTHAGTALRRLLRYHSDAAASEHTDAVEETTRLKHVATNAGRYAKATDAR